MFYYYSRLALTVMLLGLALVFQFTSGWNASWPFFAGALALILIYFLLGTTRLAFQALQRGDVNRAEKLLRQTLFPGLLVKNNRAQYHFVKGLVHLQYKEWDDAQAEIEKAIQTGLTRKKEEALAHLNLAHLHFVRNRPRESRSSLEAARLIPTDDLLLRERLDELEKALSRKFPYRN
jgi:Flp pilus assembly protein TadD